jgi:hypothetical protein
MRNRAESKGRPGKRTMYQAITRYVGGKKIQWAVAATEGETLDAYEDEDEDVVAKGDVSSRIFLEVQWLVTCGATRPRSR